MEMLKSIFCRKPKYTLVRLVDVHVIGFVDDSVGEAAILLFRGTLSERDWHDNKDKMIAYWEGQAKDIKVRVATAGYVRV